MKKERTAWANTGSPLPEPKEICAGNGASSPLSCFFSLSPVEFTVLSTLLGVLLTDSLDLGQQNSLGNFLVNTGQAVLTAAAQGQLLESEKEAAGSPSGGGSDSGLRQELDCLKKQVEVLERRIGRR